MIEISNAVYPSPEYMKMVVLGARNSYCSRDRSDSDKVATIDGVDVLMLGSSDTELLQRLSKGNSAESKYLRMMHVIFDMKAPLYFWKQFDTYKIGTVSNSESTMHSITKKHLDLSDFSFPDLYSEEDEGIWYSTLELLNTLIDEYNESKDKNIWQQLISILPNGYMQKRTIDINYAVLKSIYDQRKGHKLGEWKQFLDWIMDIPYAFLIVGYENWLTWIKEN